VLLNSLSASWSIIITYKINSIHRQQITVQMKLHLTISKNNSTEMNMIPCVIETCSKNGHFKDSKKNIRMETNGEPTTGKTETGIVG
jgi:hypothetical protein